MKTFWLEGEVQPSDALTLRAFEGFRGRLLLGACIAPHTRVTEAAAVLRELALRLDAEATADGDHCAQACRVFRAGVGGFVHVGLPREGETWRKASPPPGA